MTLITLVLVSSIGLSLLWLQPRWLWTTISSWLCPGAVFFVETQQPMVALTIDDGPDETIDPTHNTTHRILQVLAKYDAHGTFFLIGSRIQTDRSSQVAEMVRQGHEVGNHLWTDDPSIRLPHATFESQLLQTQHRIVEAAIVGAAQPTAKAMSVKWLRPGGGMGDRTMIDIAQKHGYRVALGSIWPYDTLIAASPFAVAQILSNVQPGDIIILHDRGEEGQWGKRTAQTLEQVLPALQKRGFKVVTLSQLLDQSSLDQSSVPKNRQP